MHISIPIAEHDDTEVEVLPARETRREKEARLAAAAATRSADWRARRAEEEAEVRKKAARDAAIVDTLVTAAYVAEQVGKRTGTGGEPTFTIKDVLRICCDRIETIGMSRAEALRQLHARLAPGVACPF